MRDDPYKYACRVFCAETGSVIYAITASENYACNDSVRHFIYDGKW